MNFKNKLLKCLVISAFLSLFFTTTVLASTNGTVSGDNVNVRSGPSLTSSVVTRFTNGHAVEIIGESGDFYRISVDGQELYISQQFVEVSNADARVNTNNVNIRLQPNTDSLVLGTLREGTEVSVLGRTNGWYEVRVDGIEGFIRSDFLSGAALANVVEVTAAESNSFPTTNVTAHLEFHGVVNAGAGLRLRTGPSTNADVIQVLHRGQPFEILDTQGDWILANINNRVGFVSAEFVTVREGGIPEGSFLARELVDFGLQFLGTPYLWGGTNLRTGVDCSGFVFSVFRNFGITLNRTSRGMSTQGTAVARADLLPGDLVFFDTFAGGNQGRVSHVGIYMGNGDFVHSSSSRRTWGVVISNLSEPYYDRYYVSARRILNY